MAWSTQVVALLITIAWILLVPELQHVTSLAWLYNATVSVLITGLRYIKIFLNTFLDRILKLEFESTFHYTENLLHQVSF